MNPVKTTSKKLGAMMYKKDNSLDCQCHMLGKGKMSFDEQLLLMIKDLKDNKLGKGQLSNLKIESNKMKDAYKKPDWLDKTFSIDVMNKMDKMDKMDQLGKGKKTKKVLSEKQKKYQNSLKNIMKKYNVSFKEALTKYKNSK